MKTVLLTGATGFLGSHLLESLLKNKYQVIILKRSTSDTWRINHLLNQVISYDVDTQSIELIFEQQNIDVILHLATLYRKIDDGKDAAEMINSNITFPVELLEYGMRNGIKGFINTGTFFEYDCSVLPVSEDSPLQPFNLYAKTKLAFETILKTYSDKIMINTFRLFSPYGEKDNQKLISILIKKALRNEKIELSEGLQKIDLIYVDDIVDGYLKSLKRIEVTDVECEYEIFNLGSGRALSIRDIVSVIEQQSGITMNKSWGTDSLLDIPIAYADINKANDILNWKPKYTVHEGIRNTISYYQNEENL